MPELYKLTVSATIEIGPEDKEILEGLQGKNIETLRREQLALDELEENGKDLTVELVELT